MKKRIGIILLPIALVLGLLMQSVMINHKHAAVYAAETQTFTITAVVDTDGKKTGSSDVKVNKGADKTFSITSKKGYVITDVKVDGQSVGQVLAYDFKNVTANHTLEAAFSSKVKSEALATVKSKETQTTAALEKLKHISPSGKKGSKAYIKKMSEWAEEKINAAQTENTVTKVKTTALEGMAKQLKNAQKANKASKKATNKKKVKVKGVPSSMSTFEKADQAITADKKNEAKASAFAMTQARSVATGKKSITLKWKSVSGATAYIIYGNETGNKYKRLAYATGTSYKISKIDKKKLAAGKYYQFIVLAANVDGQTMAVSKPIYVATSGGKYTNVKSLSVKKGLKKIKKGKKFTIKVGYRKQSSSKKIKKYRDIQYESSNTKVVKVSRKGVVKGLRKGKASIYIYAQNGCFKKLNITVK